MVRRRTGKSLQLTDRDLQILRCLHRYRFLRSTHLYGLVGGKSQKRFVERLGDLYHEGGYVDRPRQQWQTANARYMPVVYELGAAGRKLLRQHGAAADRGTVATGKDRERPYRQFQHELMIADILASIEIGVRADPALRFVAWPEDSGESQHAGNHATGGKAPGDARTGNLYPAGNATAGAL